MPYDSVFIPDINYDREGYDVRTVCGMSMTTGDIGIEIECEGNKFPKQQSLLPKEWKYTHDGSLRGEDNAEYVLAKPLKFSEVDGAIKSLYATLSAYGTVLDDSNRTSVHVHLNVQSFYLPRLTTFLGLYFSLEEILTEWCGDHRVGNLFCLRAKDAPAIVSKIKKWIVDDGRGGLTEGLHYSGMNAQALVKFGSLEIRSLRGVTDPDVVLQWVGVLRRIYELSGDYKDPRDVTEDFSGNDAIDYAKRILGEHYDVVRAGTSYTDQEFRSALYDGIRLAQDLCYCRDWSRYKPADVSKNPFGRNKNKPSAGLQAYLDQYGSQPIQIAAPTNGIFSATYTNTGINDLWSGVSSPAPYQPIALEPADGEPEENDYEVHDWAPEPEPDHYDEDF